MIKAKFYLFLFILSLYSSSNIGQEVSRMQGKLIYTPGYKIYEFDLLKRKERLLTDTESGGQSISLVDKNHVLVGSSMGASSKIQLFNIKEIVFEDIVPGDRPMYMPKLNKFFYFGGNLYIFDLDNPIKKSRKIADGSFSYAHVIPVSDNEIVFPIRGDAGKTPPYHYNVSSNNIDQLQFTQPCTPYAWRAVTKQLLCGDHVKNEFYLIGLDGQNSVPVNFPKLLSKNPLPLLYIHKYDVLILNVPRTKWFGSKAGEHFDLWVYSFKDGSVEKLLENNAPGRGGIAWVE